MNHALAAARPSVAAEPAYVAGYLANLNGVAYNAPYKCAKFCTLVEGLSTAGQARKHQRRLWESGWRAAI
jgi:hypothetical protein